MFHQYEQTIVVRSVLLDVACRHLKRLFHAMRPSRSWISFAICFFYLLPQQVKVMHKQLSLFQNATTAYFAGTKGALDDSMKEFQNKYKNNDGKKPFILEH